MLQKKNLSDIIRLLSGVLLSLKLHRRYCKYGSNKKGNQKGTFHTGSFLSLPYNNFICLQRTI
ncbi:hypothetical protein [Bacillus paranthracis]|uniref:hypothetical protein n=1 Tax=Bacillus paranthracis TaxID=2026186 RepID=UPI00399C94E6